MKHLPYARFQSIELREIKPTGWLHEYLTRQCNGLTGHIEASGYPFGQKYWGGKDRDAKGSYAPWWPYEQTGYWLDGALKCAYLAGDPSLYARAREEIDDALSLAGPDGFIGPDSLREQDRWPHAVFFRAVLAQYEITGDRRYVDALVRHYQSLPHPMESVRDVTGVEILVALFAETGNPLLLEQAESLFQQFNQKFPEHDTSIEGLTSDKVSTEHGVTFNEIAKLGAILYLADGRQDFLDAAQLGYAKLDRDQLLSDGLHSCSEHLRGRDPLDSHETCDITDHTWSLGYLLEATGNVKYADRIEEVMFNAAPGAVTKDFKALQYFSCPNQFIATSTSNHNLFLRGFNWMSYRADHEVQCCPGNVNRAMPNYVNRMWLRDPHGAIVAALYGPGELHTTVDDLPVTITQTTAYPFEQAVEFVVSPERALEFTFTVRLPAWCRRPGVTVNGRPIEDTIIPGSFHPIKRIWQPGDRVHIDLPYHLRMASWPGNGVSIHYGPLTLSLPIAAEAEIDTSDSTERQRQMIHKDFYTPHPRAEMSEFPAWNLYPASQWNYALSVEPEMLEKVAKVNWHPLEGYPLDLSNPAVTVSLPARVVKDWKLAQNNSAIQVANYVEDGQWFSGAREIQGDFTFTPPLPDPETLPARLSDTVEWIELVPYGNTLLRMTVFPQAVGKANVP